MNSSTAVGMSTDISRCLFSIIVVAKTLTIEGQSFFHFNLLKDLSAEQLVTGRVHKILTSALIFGYIEVVCSAAK